MIITTGWIAEHPHHWGDQLLGDLERIGADDLRTAGQVRLRDGRGRGIDVHRGDLQTCSYKCQGVRADAAAKIDHPANPGPQESTRVIISDLWPRRLLETGSGEEHLQGHVAELRLGLPSKRS